MKPIVLAYCLLQLLAAPLFAQKQKKIDPNETISADSARNAITSIVKELKRQHPGFFRYHDEADTDRYIDSVKASISAPPDQLAYFRKLKPIISRIGCLHTDLTLSEEYSAYLNSKPNLLPLRLFFSGDKAFITANYSGDNAIPIGAEVTCINGKSIKELHDKILPNIPSDGYNQTLKYQLLNNRTAHWYRSIIEVTDQFKVMINTVNGPKEFTLKGVLDKDIPKPEAMDFGTKPRLNFMVDGSLATLRILSFANSGIKRGKQDFKKFIDDAFKQLKANGTKDLILDLRDNTGGTDANAAYLCTYLMDKPYRYWDHIEVTEGVAQEVKGVATWFYKKPVKQDSLYLWQKSWMTKEFDFYQPQKPHKNAYTGKLYVLINGLCMSSCADIAAVLHHNKRAIFIGEETGGGYHGNTSGMMPHAELTFGITLSVPLQKYVNAVDPKLNIAHGTPPDVLITRTVNDIINPKDLEMEAALRLIK
ncbi:S41 family peptidase [Mucilaginibacter myungsuensis]|uniref:Tail specific protease domain-containing protein n=1 Tax=Mucilaginibacter myungsuensis TaxID=649104 RepID=A0A929L1L7_9SPHI|nr:S41 family peptidase [Mucilaginibacter myungsuensis]MBE9664468.1 hypothetical protein [Mucilaginibacter myungsuensis]MDN3601387.1 S41 family peptidase [Mucilaginibacter myungsuensis]